MAGPDLPDAAAAPVQRRRRPSRRTGALVLAAALAVGGAAAVTSALTSRSPAPEAASPAPARHPERSAPAPPSPSPTATPGPTTSAPAPPSSPSSVPVARPQPTSSATLGERSGIRLQVPAVGVDLPVHALRTDDGAIDPPTMSDAYWIEPYGEPGAGPQAPDNTVYVAAHSWSRGDAAFNAFLRADRTGSTVAPGDEVDLDTPSGRTTYRVTDVQRYGKKELPSADAVWEVHPGRLVLITCFQRDGGRRSVENLVITAEAG